MIARIIVSSDSGRVDWIAHGCVKIDDGVEYATLQNPRINLLPNRFPLRRKKLDVRLLKERALEGRYGRPNNSNILCHASDDSR